MRTGSSPWWIPQYGRTMPPDVACNMVWRVKTPHRASSRCCHGTYDGRMTKHNHTPSMKARQLSRHICNKIPRGTYQHTEVRTGPGHQTRQTAGRGKAKKDRERSQTKGEQQDRSSRANPSTERSATEPGRQQDAPTGALQTKRSQEPNRATHQENHKATKGAEGSTHHICAERSALALSK